MKHLATVFADIYRKKHWLSEDTIDCMEYTLKSFLNEISKFLLYGLIFAGFHLLPDYIISYLVFVTLRLFTGGIHCKTYWKCFLLSFVFILICVLLPHFLVIRLWILIVIAGFSLILPILFAPVTPSFRMIKKKEDRVKLRVLAVLVTLFWIVTAVLVMPHLIWAEIILYSIILVNVQLIFVRKKEL